MRVAESHPRAAAPVRAVKLGPQDVAIDRRADGALLLRSTQTLGSYPAKITECLEHSSFGQ